MREGHIVPSVVCGLALSHGLVLHIGLKCHYDQILDIHFFTVSDTIGLS